jgi:positive regulator of sigma E activity
MVQVVETDSGYMVIKPVEEGCHSCSSQGCGVSNLSRLFGKREYSLKVENKHNFQAGDTAELLLDESVFMRAVSLQYVLPLISMMVCVMLATWLSVQLPIQAIAAIVGLWLGIVVARQWIKMSENQVGSEHLQVRRVS